jgi:imidazole glycerol-phosphate synthase subunit HisH
MITIVEGVGSNVASIKHALARVGERCQVTADAAVIAGADKLILPGVGHASTAMRQLKKLGLIDTLRNITQPILGICLGMQLLYARSEEGSVDTLGLIPGEVSALKTESLPLPHMGWSPLRLQQAKHPLLHNIAPESYVYFVHSFACPINDCTVASADYTRPFSAICAKDNVMGMQFHPERSGDIGEQLLANFVRMPS